LVAPLPVRMTEEPEQSVGLDAVAVTVGVGLTVTRTVAVPEHPAPLVPVTVYTVVLAGVTLTAAPVRPPGFQVYAVAPVAVRVELLPGQTTAGAAEGVITGSALMDTATVAVRKHRIL
jgi:hypothetical protein